MLADDQLFPSFSAATLHILLALADQELHGYGIMQVVAQETGGRFKLGPGTLYDNLQRLLEQGLVEEAGRPKGEDARRRYYRLSPVGKRALAAEITRLEGVVRRGKLRLGLAGKEA